MGNVVIEELAVSLQKRLVLEDISFTVPPGTVTAIVGPNGAGKSTLLRALAGVVPLHSGRVAFGGIDLGRIPRRQRARLVALVEQRTGTEVSLSTRRVIELGRIPHQRNWFPDSAEDARIIEAAIQSMELGALADRAFSKLSGGEQQRAQIARAIAQEPQILLLDEPTNHLDIRAQRAVLRLARSEADSGRIVVMTLHDLNHAAAVADQIIVLMEGRVRASGRPWQVLTQDTISEVFGVDAVLIPHPHSGHPLLVLAV